MGCRTAPARGRHVLACSVPLHQETCESVQPCLQLSCWALIAYRYSITAVQDIPRDSCAHPFMRPSLHSWPCPFYSPQAAVKARVLSAAASLAAGSQAAVSAVGLSAAAPPKISEDQPCVTCKADVRMAGTWHKVGVWPEVLDPPALSEQLGTNTF